MFHEQANQIKTKVQPESKNLAVSTLKSVINGLFYARYPHLHQFVTQFIKLAVLAQVGSLITPEYVLAAAMDISCRERQMIQGTGKLGNCYNSQFISG